ncbi:calcium/sodium antiporter [Bacteroidota bacterium]
MLDLIIWIGVFVVALIVLIKAADYFTDSAEKIGLFFGMSSFVVGITIVALGTSIPELATSIVAVFRNASEIVIGDVVGSNITNILLVIGAAGVLSGGIILKHKFSRTNKTLFIGSALLLVLFSIDRFIEPYEAAVLFCLYILYIAMLVRQNNHNEKSKVALGWKPVITLILSVAAIYFGAEYVIKSVVMISKLAKIGADVIAAGAIALGTSLPELVVSVTAVRKNKHDMAVGNIIGSNIFNILMVVGISGLFAPLLVTETMAVFGMIFMAVATVIFLVFLRDMKIERWEGIILLILYITFILKLFGVF